MKFLYLAFGLVLATSSAHADRIKILANDHDALQARVDIIQQAQHEILAEYFSVWNDDQSVGGFSLLMDAAKKGIKVKVVIDALSNTVPKSFFTTMMENGRDARGNLNFEIKLYNPTSINLFKLTHRDHSKLLIVDGKVMITGGRNVGDKYFGLNAKRNFNDLDVILDGQAVTDARENFLTTFNSKFTKPSARERDLPSRVAAKPCVYTTSTYDEIQKCERRKKVTLEAYHETVQRVQKNMADIMDKMQPSVILPNTGTDWLADVDSNSDVEFISHKPEKLVTKKTDDLTDALMGLMASAKKDLNIMTPYLIPTQDMYATLEKLIQNGVKVRVVTNSPVSTDNVLAQAAYQNSKDRLIKIGVELYECNGPNTCHGKAMVIDDTIAFIGTYNLDPRSAYINREVGILVRSSAGNLVAQELTDEIEKFRQSSLLVAKDGQPQNVEAQKKLYKTLSKGKRALLRTLRIIAPFIRSQI